MKFRNKPIVIEAMQVPEVAIDASKEFLAFLHRGIAIEVYAGRSKRMTIVTHYGTTEGEPGDWVVNDALGNLFICAADIFEAMYEKVEEEETK